MTKKRQPLLYKPQDKQKIITPPQGIPNGREETQLLLVAIIEKKPLGANGCGYHTNYHYDFLPIPVSFIVEQPQPISYVIAPAHRVEPNAMFHVAAITSSRIPF